MVVELTSNICLVLAWPQKQHQSSVKVFTFFKDPLRNFTKRYWTALEFNLLWWKKGLREKSREIFNENSNILSEFTPCCTLHARGFENAHYKQNNYKNKLECLWIEYRNCLKMSSLYWKGLVWHTPSRNDFMITKQSPFLVFGLLRSAS